MNKIKGDDNCEQRKKHKKNFDFDFLFHFFLFFTFIMSTSTATTFTTMPINLKIHHYFGSSQVLLQDNSIDPDTVILDYLKTANKSKTQLPILRLYSGNKFKSKKVWDYALNPTMTFGELPKPPEYVATMFGETFSFD